MREILFRGKRVDNGEWTEAQTFMCAKNVDGSEKAFYLGARNPMIQYDDKFGNIGILETDTSSPIFYKVIPETVGQYIGLNDKNGKKIFEGDFLRKISKYNNKSYYGLVRSEVWNCGCCHPVYGWSTYNDSVDLSIHDECEVIGNIHDNPELREMVRNDEED